MRGAKEPLALPKNGDPYSGIYLSSAWYGLVPDTNLELVKGAGRESLSPSRTPARPEEVAKRCPRTKLRDVISKVEGFHQEIEKRYMVPTYAHYGSQGQRDSNKEAGGLLGTGLMASKDRFSWGEIAWEGAAIGAIDSDKITIASDDGNGAMRILEGIRLTLSDPDYPGDGTVPVQGFKWEAPAKADSLAEPNLNVSLQVGECAYLTQQGIICER